MAMKKDVKIELISLGIVVAVLIFGFWISQNRQSAEPSTQPSTKYLTVKELIDNMDFYKGKNVTLRLRYIGSACKNLQKLFPDISHEKGEHCFGDDTGEIYTDLFYHVENFPLDKELIITGEFDVRMEAGVITRLSIVKANFVEETGTTLENYCEKNSDCPPGKECFNLVCTDPDNVPISGWEECTPAGPFVITCDYVNGKCYCAYWEEWGCKSDEDCYKKYGEKARGKFKCAEQKVCMPIEVYNRYFR